MSDDREMVERLWAVETAWRTHVEANERTNAAIPELEATPAERAVYAERYRASEEAKRAMYGAAQAFAGWAAEHKAAAEIARLQALVAPDAGGCQHRYDVLPADSYDTMFPHGITACIRCGHILGAPVAPVMVEAREILAAELTQQRGYFCSPDKLGDTTLCDTETVLRAITRALQASTGAGEARQAAFGEAATLIEMWLAIDDAEDIPSRLRTYAAIAAKADRLDQGEEGRNDALAKLAFGCACEEQDFLSAWRIAFAAGRNAPALSPPPKDSSQ